MPLRVKLLVEPFTELSKSEEPILAESDEYKRLSRDLERYAAGQIQGRSYLVAGHRGSGKTMLVHKVIEDLMRKSADRDTRPLFVRLHGPDLLPPPSRKPADSDDSHDEQEGAQVEEPEGEKKEGEKEGEKKEPKKGHAAAEKKKPEEEAAVAAEDEGSDAALKIVLRQMTKALFRAVTEEYRRCYREMAFSWPAGLARDHLLEIASQFDLELTEAITESLTPSRLRGYWQRVGGLPVGILFPRVPRSYRTYRKTPSEKARTADDIAFQEILVLSFLSQAFQVVSGKIQEKQSRTDAAKRESSSTLTTAYALKNLFAPVAGLLTGGFVGLQVKADPISAVLLGLLTGAVVSFGFSFSGTRTRSRGASLESVFIRDRDVPTLSSVLPMLIVRLKEIGLAPVFVIDELDKVHDLNDRMRTLVRHLKFLVTENSFTCFLTDRRYLTYLNQQADVTAYAREYTYFSDRLLVLYTPDSLREFIRSVFEYAPPAGDSQEPADAAKQQSQFDAERERIAYIILHRSRLHPIDIRRRIDRLSAMGKFTSESAFPSTQYSFDLLMQVAVEWIFKNGDVQSQIGADLESRQVVYDALYYVSRLWEDASDAQTLPGFTLTGKDGVKTKPGFKLNKIEFSKYLESRCEEETERGKKPGAAKDAAPGARQAKTGGVDFDFLFEKVSDLVNVLAKPEWFIESLGASNAVSSHIRNALPRRQVLIEYIPESDNEYRWVYDFSGRYVETLDVSSVIRDVRGPVASIREWMNRLQDSFGAEVSLQKLADLSVIPRTPPWGDVESALSRLSLTLNENRNYLHIGTDRDCVINFQRNLMEFEPNMKAALLCAALLARDLPGRPAQAGGVEAPKADMLSKSLSQVSEFLKLEAWLVEDFRRLTSVLDSPFSGSTVKPADDWEVIRQSALDALAENKPRDAGPIVESAWKIFKDRFTSRYRNSTSYFVPKFEDLFTSMLDVGPGRRLSFDLSAIYAAQWSSLLVHSFGGKDKQQRVPDWMRVAAALELNQPGLAERLSATLREDPAHHQAGAAGDPLPAQWVRDFKMRSAAPPEGRRNVLILTAEGAPLTAKWLPSSRHGSLVLTAPEFGQLVKALKRLEVSQSAGFPFDLVCVELKDDDPATLGKLVGRHPADVLKEMWHGKRDGDISEIMPLLESREMSYIVKETPRPHQSSPQMFNYVVSPEGINNLVERLPKPPPPKPS
jgi:hypothetical protein